MGSTIPQILNDFSDVQTDPALMRHANKVINGVTNYSKEAALYIRYIGEFISLDCAPDMLSMRLFPNAKEISESFGAFHAVHTRLHPDWHLGDPDIHMVAVGDGRTPRTAATFAFRSNWQCHSVDPILKGGVARWMNIKRLTLHPQKVEEFHLEADRVIIVAVHSHATLKASLTAIHARELAVVAMPCCVPLALKGIPPDMEYQDKSIISPHRTIKIWKDVAHLTRGENS